MTFVLVDYKGGSAFKDCVHLPHVTGMVTDLDAHLVERALASLSAELTRREHILAAAGAKDIEDYTALLDRQAPARRQADRGPEPPLEALPRLVIVIDEFASMVRDLPDFVTGLVNIAQRGRSLGIHLILATQRPSGVVSADIRANTNLRIALRVTDAAESADVIDAPDAAHISRATPGRGLRAARPRLARPVPGRPGRRAAPRRRPDDRGSRPRLVPVDWAALGSPEPGDPKPGRGARRRRSHRPEGPRRGRSGTPPRPAHPRSAQPVARAAAAYAAAARPARPRGQATGGGAGTDARSGSWIFPGASSSSRRRWTWTPSAT